MFTTYTGPDGLVLDSSVTRTVGTIAFGYRLVVRICMVPLRLFDNEDMVYHTDTFEFLLTDEGL